MILSLSLASCGNADSGSSSESGSLNKDDGKIKNGVWKCSSIEQFVLPDKVNIRDLGYDGEISTNGSVDLVCDFNGHKGNVTFYLDYNKIGSFDPDDHMIDSWHIECSKEDGEYWFDEISDKYEVYETNSKYYSFKVKESNKPGKIWTFEITTPQSKTDEVCKINYWETRGSMDS